MMPTKTNETSAPIAIIGMACRFAGDVSTPSELWELCAAGKDGWSPIPTERFDVKSFYDPDKEKPGRVRLSLFLSCFFSRCSATFT